MLVDDRLYIDNTIYKSVFSCSLQLVLRHALHWNSREDSIHLRAGTAMHEAQAAWNIMAIRGHDSEAARAHALDVFRHHYFDYAEQWAEPDSRMEYNNLHTILDEWFATRWQRLPWYVTDERLIEVGFAYPLDPRSGRDVAFGRMDLIARDNRDNAWLVVDHKSTGRIDLNWVDSWAIDSQVTQYFWGGLQHVPDLSGFYVNGIEFGRLPGSDRKCKEHGMAYAECSRYHMKAQIIGPLTRTPEFLARWRADALRGAEKARFYLSNYDPKVVGPTPDLSNVEMEGPFTGGCRFCAFKDWCRTGQNPKALPTMYVQDSWAPFDPRTFDEVSPVSEILGVDQ